MLGNVHSASELFFEEAIETMTSNILFLLDRIGHLLEQQGRCKLAEQFGLTTTQVLILSCPQFQRGESLCATDLHQMLGRSKAALSVALKDLYESGYLRVASCPGDERKKQIEPTAKALKVCRQLEVNMKELERRACTGLTGAQVEEIRQNLAIMTDNLSGPALERC